MTVSILHISRISIFFVELLRIKLIIFDKIIDNAYNYLMICFEVYCKVKYKSAQSAIRVLLY
jgi:hypothetical protein